MKKTTNLANLGHIGSGGENAATQYLESKSFKIVFRNYRSKWGEIDIVCFKSRTLYFFEVKSVQCAHEDDVYTRRPEERVNEEKRVKLRRVIRSYLVDRFGTEEKDFEFGVISVFLLTGTKKVFVRVIRETL